MNFPRRALCRAVSIALLSGSVALPAQADFVSADGYPGAAGLNGEPGNPGGRGGDGGNGDDALAAAQDVGSSTALAYGGDGGNGGFGGDGTAPGGLAGAGGAGGRGGAADASAQVSGGAGNIQAEARAKGGAGGAGGIHGADYWQTPWTAIDANRLGAAGDGGNATANASGSASSHGMAATITSYAAGGDAGSIFVARPGAGNGGNATSTASAGAVDASLAVKATALGGNGSYSAGGTGGAGGHATAYASANNASSGNGGTAMVRSEASATGGAGGSGAVGAQAEARAWGASGDGAVDVIATQTGGRGGAVPVILNMDDTPQPAGAGGDSFMIDQVDGSTAGQLSLTQHARGGDGGEGYATGFGELWIGAAGGKGGNAGSSLSVNRSNELILTGLSRATGGNSGAGASGGDATANIKLTGGEVVVAQAVAEGGAGGNADGYSAPGDGGNATIGRAYGRSTTGGRVSVAAQAIGGSGGSGGGNGATTSLTNVVDGATSGVLELLQIASGGDSQSGYGGNASSVLEKTNQGAAVLTIEARAFGGAGQGSASTSATGNADRGQLNVITHAFGGAGLADAPGSAGGDAFSEARGHIDGDGNEVYVSGNASGGDSSVTAMPGGTATSSSTGIAYGNSAVQVFDSATGGLGGGRANSHAFAANTGDATVYVGSLAIGGDNSNGIGGSAKARAWGQSASGDVYVLAGESGGNGLRGADAVLVDQAGGRTSGILSLAQHAYGGASDSGEAGGEARSELTFSDSQARQIHADVSATGGWSDSGTGGAARVEIELHGAGDVGATGVSNGGYSYRGNGGDAQSSVRAFSAGANSTVTVQSSAIGGDQRDGTGYGSAGRPGNATSSAEGTGHARVVVTDSAQAGVDPNYGRAADASSQARAYSLGGEAVSRSTAHAIPDYWSYGGKARADALASSLGGGDVQALASALGKDSAAVAAAETRRDTGPVRGIDTRSSSTAAVSAQAVAQASFGGDLLSAVEPIADPVGLAVATALPTQAEVDAALAGSPTLAARLEDNQMLALGLLYGRTWGPGTSSYGSVHLSLDGQAFDPDQHLLLSFFDPFGNQDINPDLTLSVTIDGVSVFEQNFPGGFTAGELFERTLDLGAWSSLPADLELELALSGSGIGAIGGADSAAFALGVVFSNTPSPVPVPAPAAAWLLGSGLATLGAIRRRRRAT